MLSLSSPVHQRFVDFVSLKNQSGFDPQLYLCFPILLILAFSFSLLWGGIIYLFILDFMLEKSSVNFELQVLL